MLFLMTASGLNLTEATIASPPPRRRGFRFFDRSSFLTRSDLFANPGQPTLMVIVELVKQGDWLRAGDRDELMAELENSLAEAAGSSATCYRLRKSELCILVADVDLDDADNVLDEIVGAAEATAADLSASVVFGEIVIPDEAEDPRVALRVADQRLKAQKRERGIEKKGLIIGRRDPGGQMKASALGAFFREGDQVSLVYESEATIKLGDLVLHQGSRAYVRAFSPMSMPERTVELEDAESGTRFVAPWDDVVRDPQAVET
jgi:GGDEF domain-containing protein